MKNIFAYTPPGSMPPYVSINRQSADCVTITVRGPLHESKGDVFYGPTAEIALSQQQFGDLVRALMREWLDV